MRPSVWSASGRVIVSVNGVNAPAWMFVVPAWNPGLNGCGSAHGAPLRSRRDFKARGRRHRRVSRPRRKRRLSSCRCRIGPASLSGARSPPKKCNSASSKGSCGVSRTSSIELTRHRIQGDLPWELYEHTRDRVSARRDTSPQAIRNGFSSGPSIKFCGAAKYIAPSSAFGKSGVLIFTVATFDASGQKLTPGSSGVGSSGVNSSCASLRIDSLKADLRVRARLQTIPRGRAHLNPCGQRHSDLLYIRLGEPSRVQAESLRDMHTDR